MWYNLTYTMYIYIYVCVMCPSSLYLYVLLMSSIVFHACICIVNIFHLPIYKHL